MRRWLIGTFTALVVGMASAQEPATEHERVRMAPWPDEVLAAVSRIPVQDGGRIKPLSTFAAFQLRALNTRRRFETEWGEKLTPVAWMLDCLFFPEQARHYKVLLVADDRVLDAVGLKIEGRVRRDRYSLAELMPGMEKLRGHVGQIRQKESRNRDALERQILKLWERLPLLERLVGYLDFARVRFDTAADPALKEAFPKRKEVAFTDVVPRYVELRKKLDWNVHRQINDVVRSAGHIRLLAPVDEGDETYKTPAELFDAQASGLPSETAYVAVVRRLQSLVDIRDDLAGLGSGLIELQVALEKPVKERGEFGKIDAEIGFYKADWFWNALYSFFGGFLFCLALWIVPRSKVAYVGAWGLNVCGLVLLATGIVSRCVIRGRPPVTTPYEAILFVVSVAVIITLFVEYTRRNGLPLTLAAVAGALGLRLAMWHEDVEGADTMEAMVAVLDTNFWLSIHVTAVTLGYCAGTLAALIANLYIFAKAWDVVRGWSGKPHRSRAFYSDVSRIIYGVLCFGLLFSTVGTILGGVWANDSWGRFWGWDPKENGALMLVLGFLAIAHARMGGYLREHGIAVASVGLGIIVMWAFWGVNRYQVGLHSYGFSDAKKDAEFLYYWVQYPVIAIGILAWFGHQFLGRRAVGAGTA